MKKIKKPKEVSNNKNQQKKTTSIAENNNTILNFFKVNSDDNNTSIKNKIPKEKLDKANLNENLLNKSPNSNYNEIGNNIKINNDNSSKIDISNFILFTKNFCQQINNIFTNNFINHFNNYLNTNFKDDRKKLDSNQILNISKLSFTKFVQQIFENFITKYLLNRYINLIYISERYMQKNNIKNDYSEIELLSYDDKRDILLEYSPINITESKLFFPELSSTIVKFIKSFKQEKCKKKPSHALLFRPNYDFTSYINKIKLICNQMGYNLLKKEDEPNKLMTFEKLKLINKNYIIGSLKDKNKNYLQIIEHISISLKWKKFLDCINNINKMEKEDKISYKNQDNFISNNFSKSQSTKSSSKSISKRFSQAKNRIKINGISSNNLLTFIGHNSPKEIQINKDNYSKEYIIAKNYKQNILEKFNKRKNVILFLDNFDENEDNIKYINQINSIIPNSQSPIIILTNNLSLFMNHLTNENSNYFLHQIENEGIFQKENIIYMTFLIMYFHLFFPKIELEKQNSEEKMNEKDIEINNNMNDNNSEKDRELENELDFVINIANEENETSFSYNSEKNNYDYNLDRIKNEINTIFTNTNLKYYNHKVYISLLTLSYIISMKNQYELDNILVYLKNLFQSIDSQLNNIHIKQDSLNILTLAQNIVLKENEEYEIIDNVLNIEENNITKISEIYENDSFSDYEYGYIYSLGEKEYENKLKNYEINNGIDFNKESYFYTNKFCNLNNFSNNFNYISNKEIKNRIIEDHKFFQNYYTSSNSNLNYSDIKKINMILIHIINNDTITLEDISRFIGVRYSKRNKIKNNSTMNEKISILNRIFRKCPIELFTKYINAHFWQKYYVEFNIDNKKYHIPEKLLFYNYYNDYNLIEQIQSKQKIKYSKIQDDEEDEDDFNDDEESELY